MDGEVGDSPSSSPRHRRWVVIIEALIVYKNYETFNMNIESAVKRYDIMAFPVLPH